MSGIVSWFSGVPRRAGLRVGLALGVALVTFAGCGGGSAVPAHAASHEVAMREYKFVQPQLRVAVGDSVSWVNYDPDSHNIAILEGPELNVSPEQPKGAKWSMTFTKPGRYHYYCEFHPWMVADVIVGGNESTASTERAAQTFKETGKSVRGKFLQYWQKNGGLAQQGFPISEEMVERSETNGQYYTVQYFERAVFELHPEEKPPYDVLLSLLGTFEYGRKYPNGAPGQQPNTSAGSVLFKETGKRVGGRFLQYWQKNGGLAQQGLPISEEFNEKSELDGKTYRVQYFERAVFEMHPENKPPYDVLLSQLGKFRHDKVVKAGEPNALGIRQIGISASPQHYPLLEGPHAAPGLNVYIYDQDPAPVVQWMDDLGTKWALHQLSWYQIETEPGVYRWEKIDRAIDALYKAGIKIVLHPVHSPPWEWTDVGKVGYPKNIDNFKKFMTAVAQRYKGKVAAYQIWNEPNLAIESGKYVVAARYAEVLKAGYTSVKAVDPAAIIVTAALTPTGVNDPNRAVDDVIFLRRLYAYNNGELKGYFDVLGAHPGSNANPPDTLHPEKPGPGPGWNTNASFYFRRIEQIRQVMVENGDAGKQMWLTEFGWASTEQPAPGFEYAAQNSEQEQADYIGKAFRMGRDNYPWMGPMLLFQLNFGLPNVATEPTDERIAWGILRRDGSKRPAYFAVQQYAREYNGGR
ncbi:MAG TPA: plastocyanin/azurin family copper-binding protein [Chloroflexia bacterium]|jgi:plastocyanin